MSFGRLWPRGKCWVAYVGADDSRRLLQAAASLHLTHVEYLAPRPGGVVLATPCLPGPTGLAPFRNLLQKIGLLLHAPVGGCWVGLATGWCQEFPTPLMQPDLAGEGVVRAARVVEHAREYARSQPSTEPEWFVSVDEATWAAFEERANELTGSRPGAGPPSSDQGGRSRSLSHSSLATLIATALATDPPDGLLAELEFWLTEASTKGARRAASAEPVQRWTFSAIFDIVDSSQDRPRQALPWWHTGLARSMRKHLPALFAIVGRLDQTSEDMGLPPPDAPALTEAVFYASTGDGMELCFFDEAGADDKPPQVTEGNDDAPPATADGRRSQRAHEYMDWLLTVLHELRLQGIWVRAVASYWPQDTVLLDRLGSAWAAGSRSCVPLDAAAGAAPSTLGAHQWARAAIKERPLAERERGRYIPTLMLNGLLKCTLEQHHMGEAMRKPPAAPIGQALANRGDRWVPCVAGAIPDDALGVYLPLATRARPESDQRGRAGREPRAAWQASPQLSRLTVSYDERAARGRGLAEVCEEEMIDDSLAKALTGLKQLNTQRALYESTITACIGSSLLARVVPGPSALLASVAIIAGAVVLAYVFSVQAGDLFASAVWSRLAPTLPRSLFKRRVREYRERKKTLLRLVPPIRNTANQIFGRGDQFWEESDIDREGKYLVTSLGTNLPWIVPFGGAVLVALCAALCAAVVGWSLPRADLAAGPNLDADSWLWTTAATVALFGLEWNLCLHLRLRKISLRHFSLRRTEVENEARAFKVGGWLDVANGIGHLSSVFVLGLALASTERAAPASILGLVVCVASGWHSMHHLRVLRVTHRDLLRGVEPPDEVIGDPLHTSTRTLAIHREILDLAMKICARSDRGTGERSQAPLGVAASFVADYQGVVIHMSGPDREDSFPQGTEAKGLVTADFYADGAYAAKVIGEIIRYSRRRWIVLEVMGQTGRAGDSVRGRPYIMYATALPVRKLPTGYLALFVPTDRDESVYVCTEDPGRQDINKRPDLLRAAGWGHLAELAPQSAPPADPPDRT